MRFAFTDDQRAFAAALRDLLDKECTPAHVRAAWEGDGTDPALWRHLGEQGVLAMLLPESDGGLGGTEVDLVLLLQELGRAGVPGPVLEHAAVAAPALRGTEWAAGLASGELVATVAFDGSPYVAHAPAASIVLTAEGVVSGFTVAPVESLAGGRRLAVIEGGTVAGVDVDRALAFDRGALAAAAVMCGAAERMVDLAAEYARQRHQFGKPIGSFQAVKHLLADALLKIEFAKPAVYAAAWAVATDQPTRSRDVSLAKAFASEAAEKTARATLQVHGAIGYTEECDLQLWLKPSWALARAWGDARWHRRRIADAVLGPR